MLLYLLPAPQLHPPLGALLKVCVVWWCVVLVQCSTLLSLSSLPLLSLFPLPLLPRVLLPILRILCRFLRVNRHTVILLHRLQRKCQRFLYV